MVSGFNHIEIVLGDDFAPFLPYKITEQVSEDIFNNDKQLYCHVIFPKKMLGQFSFRELIVTMAKLGESEYVHSIVKIDESGSFIGYLGISKLDDGEVYLTFSYVIS